MFKTITLIAVALIVWGSLLYAIWYFCFYVLKQEVKKQAGVRELSDKHITETGDIVRYKKSRV